MTNDRVASKTLARIHYEIDDDLHRRAKSSAALKGVTLREYVEQAIAKAVETDEAKK